MVYLEIHGTARRSFCACHFAPILELRLISTEILACVEARERVRACAPASARACAAQFWHTIVSAVCMHICDL